MRLTKSQHALVVLIYNGHLYSVQNLLGPNHPTSKWFRRQTGRSIMDGSRTYLMHWAEGVLKKELADAKAAKTRKPRKKIGKILGRTANGRIVRALVPDQQEGI